MQQETFGVWLKRQRIAKRLSQSELASQVGCSVTALRKVEADANWPSQQLIDTLLAKLGVVLPGYFAALTTEALRVRRNILPNLATPLIGRAAEIDIICAYFRGGTRLLNLLGPGGIGKTYLSIQAAHLLLSDFPDGCVFVDLAPIRDPNLVLPTIAKALGLQEHSRYATVDQLSQALDGQQVLLVLDNLEHVLACAVQLVDLLTALPDLAILATSRAILHVSGERVFQVQPLGLPSAADLQQIDHSRADQLMIYSAIELFVARAQAAGPAFAVSGEHIATIAAICIQLDGLPLAIELSAARCRLFTPTALLAHLEQRLSLLVHGPQDLPRRQQTLRATIDWSYELLEAAGQRLFRQLAIFHGGWTLEGAEAVCGVREREYDGAAATASTVGVLLSGLELLLDSSLLFYKEQADGARRYSMYETIREYALERLIESGEFVQIREAHSAYYLELAQMAAYHFDKPDQADWLHYLEHEHENIRAVLAWCLAPGGNPGIALQMVNALGYFWMVRGYYQQGLMWMLRALAGVQDTYSLSYANVLQGAGRLARCLNDLKQSTALVEQSLAIYRALGDHEKIAIVLDELGAIAIDRSDFAEATLQANASLQLAERIGATLISAWALYHLGHVACWKRDYQEAHRVYTESLVRFRRLGEQTGIGFALWSLARMAKDQFDYPRATRLAEECLTTFHELDYRFAIAMIQRVRAEIALAQGDTEGALSWCTQGFELMRGMNTLRFSAWIRITYGMIAEVRGSITVAYAHYNEGWQLFEQFDDPEGHAKTIQRMSCLTMRAGDALAARHLMEVYVVFAQDAEMQSEALLGACLRDAALIPLDTPKALALLQFDLAACRETDDPYIVGYALRTLGMALLDAQAEGQSLACFQEGLELAGQADDLIGVVTHVIGLAHIALRQHEFDEAARLYWIINRLEVAIGSGMLLIQLWPPDYAKYSHLRESLHEHAPELVYSNPQVAETQLASINVIQEVLSGGAALQAYPLSVSIDSPVQEATMEQGLPDLEAFAYLVAHDLRAPLQTISGYTSILEEDYEEELNAEGQRVCAIIRQETGRMGQLITDLLAFARFGAAALHLEQIDMAPLVADVFHEVTLLEDRGRITFLVDDLPLAEADRSILRQVWVNLLSNAVKYSAKRAQAVIRVQGAQTHSEVIYQVQDNGAGFDMAHAAKLFGVFQRLHSEQDFPGTGVGLAIVQRIIKRHGGRIWAESVLDQGATFHFSLPIRRYNI